MSSHSEPVRKCVLHLDNSKPSVDDVILFKDLTLKKCKDVELVYLGRLNSKFSSVKLPESIDSISGYHAKCYKAYTAVSLKEISAAASKVDNIEIEENVAVDEPPELSSSSGGPSLRSSVDTRRSSFHPVFDSNCIFCGKIRKEIKGRREKLQLCLTTVIQEGIALDANVLNDAAMLRKIAVIVDFIAKEVRYHPSCRLAYSGQAKAALSKNKKENESLWRRKKAIREKAFEATVSFMETKIIEFECVQRAEDIISQYVMWLEEFGLQDMDVTEVLIRKSTIINKLTEHFGDRMSTYIHPTTGIGKIFFKSTLSIQKVLESKFDVDNKLPSKVREAAFILRNLILKHPKKPLPSKVTVKDIMQGETEIPALLREFFACLITGPEKRKGRPVSEKKNRRIDSMSHDAIFVVTNGRTKPSKQLLLSLVIKSLTGKRKVVDLLNRLGHGVSYNVAEELETELTFTASESARLLPDGLHPLPHLFTGVAFDNYDRFVETLTGRDTLHDTVGIVYQDVVQVDFEATVQQDQDQDSTIVSSSTRRRRAFEATGLVIEPYHKKPRMTKERMSQIDDPKRAVVPPSIHTARLLDFLWMCSLSLRLEGIPMWTGWNSTIVKNIHPMQTVCYLPQVNVSPTSIAVVVETMNMSRRLAEECEQRYISVTYDLAIAKIALTVQAEEKPKFDNLFIQLGTFHIELSFFKAIGKYIEESGGPYILIEAGALAQGSLLGFLSGKHYNRCKRIHPIFAAALQTLHFDEFLNVDGRSFLEQEVRTILCKLKQEDYQQMSSTNAPPEILNLFEKYETFCNKTLTGEHGCTAKYWMIYIKLIDVYHQLSRAVRTGDYQLYIFLLPEIVKMFFVFNHQNYARWLTRFHDNLMNMETSHPGITEYFEKGMLSVRRTKKQFSRLPIDLTLEQTINADAASSSTGIAALTNSISARQRWAKSHFLRMTLISHLFNHLGLNHQEDISREAHSHRIRKDRAQVNSIIDFVKSCKNPFTEKGHQNLYNLSSGKAASSETCNFLLNVRETGESLRNQFIQRCVDDPAAFEKPIPRQKLKTFSSEGVKVKKKNAGGKVEEIKMERDLMGRILAIALDNKVDMEQVLSYPLTPVPLCLSHIDGSMNKTPKAVLFKAIEKRFDSTPPSHIDVLIVDGFFFLHLCVDPPITFGKFARYILVKLCRTTAERIDLVFDQTISPSIKDVERDRRSDSQRETPFSISGSSQKRPTDFLKALRNDNFKKEIIKFLVEAFEDDNLSEILGAKTLRVTIEAKCFLYTASSGKITKKLDENLCSSHEEADTRMIAHVATITGPANVVIRTSDTDVLAIAIGNAFKISSEVKVFLEVGTQTKNTLRFIDITGLSKKMGQALSQALPGLHAFTGCDFSPAFAYKGKIRPLAIMEKSSAFQKAFSTLGSEEILPESVVKDLEKFVCEMYGHKNIASVNEARLASFIKVYKPTGKNPMGGVKGVDGSLLPPCKSVLEQQIKRVNSICSVWNNATLLNPIVYQPERNGWSLDDFKYTPNWFEGDTAPPTLDLMLVGNQGEEQESNNEDDSQENSHNNNQDDFSDYDSESSDEESSCDD